MFGALKRKIIRYTQVQYYNYRFGCIYKMDIAELHIYIHYTKCYGKNTTVSRNILLSGIG